MRTLTTVTIPLPRFVANAFFPYAGFVVVIAFVFGGGARQGLWSDAIVEILALPLFAWASFRLTPSRLGRSGRAGLVLVGAFVALPLLQLIPLPPSIWAALPGRSTIASGYDAAGIAQPWIPISLDPSATWRSLLSLIPGIAVFLAMLSLGGKERRTLLNCMLFIVPVAILIGFLQSLGALGLYFYAITNEGMAVGFFANGNHNATFLTCALPFAAAWLTESYLGPRFDRFAVVLAGFMVAFTVIGIAIVGSRAGLGLGVVAGLLCIAVAYRSGARVGKRIVVAGAGVFLVSALLAVVFGAAGWQKRNVQDRDIQGDLRWPVASVTLQAARQHFPLGSGFGTFVPIYQMNAQRADTFERYVNHAHNDWLELALEGGIAALACVLGFLGWFGATAVRAWRRWVPGGRDVNFAPASSIAIVLVLLHSTVDYPLRSIAIMTVFALCCGVLVTAADAVRRPETG